MKIQCYNEGIKKGLQCCVEEGKSTMGLRNWINSEDSNEKKFG